LRCAILVAVLWAPLAQPVLAKPPPPALAKAPVRVLVGAPVSDDARLVMSQSLWGKLIADWIGAVQLVAFPSGLPALADCKTAGADFTVGAPFDLRPRLPGMPNSPGRVAARTEITITNCLTGTVVYDQAINIDSEPPPDSSTDPDTAAQTLWAKDVPQTLAKNPAFFSRIARVVKVQAPTALVDLNGAKPGDVMRVYASSTGKARPPIYLTVKRQLGKNAEVTFSTASGGAQPAVGDFVEPVTTPKS
jgi:hypothetical protein